jgi:hypothetical protein
LPDARLGPDICPVANRKVPGDRCAVITDVLKKYKYVVDSASISGKWTFCVE